MRFTVTWHPDAEKDLAEIWIRGVDRDGTTKATARLEQILARDPVSSGVEFYGDRLLVEAPLAVTYAVSEPDRTVQIFQVWSR